MWPGMRPATGWIANLTSTPRFEQGVAQLSDLVLRLRGGHPVAGDDHDGAGGIEQEGGLLRIHAADRPLLDGTLRRRGPETAEQHVDEGSVHRLAHDDRQEQAARSVEGSGDDQQLLCRTKPIIEADSPATPLSSEITVGMSAPPIGYSIAPNTSETPQRSGRGTRHRVERPDPDHDQTRSTRSTRSRCSDLDTPRGGRG